MDWLSQVLRDKPELALFLSLALGYSLGAIRLGRFQLSPIVGSLLAGLVIGQTGAELPAVMQTVFFLLFVFAIGFRTGPEFFRSLRSKAIPYLALTVLLNLTALSMTWAIARVSGLDNGTSAGLLAGSLTNSTSLGAATNAAARLNDGAAGADVVRRIARTYALTYMLGLLLVVWFLPYVGPLLMRINIRDASREQEQSSGDAAKLSSLNAAHRDIVVRAYRLPPALDDQTVGQVEHLWPSEQRVVIERVRRADTMLEATAGMGLHAGDVVAIAGRPQALVSDLNPFTVEVDDRDLLAVPSISCELVLTNSTIAGQTLRTIGTDLGARGIFVTGLKRGGRELPFSLSTVVERGDVVSVSGTPQEVARVAAEIGYAEYPTESTDMLLVAWTIVIGGLIGLAALTVGRVSLSLTTPVGVLLAGLTLGHLRSIYPRFGRIPNSAVSLLESLGLATFLALVGLEAGPGILATLSDSGLLIVASAAAVCLVSHTVTILVGYYVLRVNPAVLLGLCAGAGTSAPALAAVEQAAGSKVPTLGYGFACATANILTAVCATLLVLMK
jgi:putative transport protein